MMKLWLSIPQWVRQTIKQMAETVSVMVLIYVYNQLQGGQTIEFNSVLLLSLKAVLKVIRSNPNIDIPDYVNDPVPVPPKK